MTALVFGGMAIALPAKAQQAPPSPPPGDAPPAVALDVAPCAQVDADEIRRLFELELGRPVAASATDNDATGSRAVSVSIDCEGATIILLRVRNDATGEELERRVDINARPARGRERLLALTASELLRSSWLQFDDESDVPDDGDGDSNDAGDDAPGNKGNADDEDRSETDDADGGEAATLGGSGRWKTTALLLGAVTREDHGVAPGGGARVIIDHTSGFGGSFDIVGATSADDTALGDIAIDSATASAAMHVRWSWRQLVGRAAVGGRAGAVSLRGEPAPDSGAQGDRVTGLVVGPFARLHLGAEFASGLALDLSVEPGYHLVPVRGLVDGARQTTLEGLWLQAHIAAGWRW